MTNAVMGSTIDLATPHSELSLYRLKQVLDEQDLGHFYLGLKNQLSITRLSHFDYVKSEDLAGIGMSRCEISHRCN